MTSFVVAIISLTLNLWCLLSLAPLPLLAAPEADRVTELPGWSPRPLPSHQYSGFVDASPDGSLKMHYWLVESEGNPAKDPLILWFNGGLMHIYIILVLYLNLYCIRKSRTPQS